MKRTYSVEFTGESVVKLDVDDLYLRVAKGIPTMLDTLMHPTLFVAVITPLPADLSILQCFEYKSIDDAGMLRVWSPRAQVQLLSDGRLNITSILPVLPGYKEKQDYLPQPPDEVVICDQALTEVNLRQFKASLPFHLHSGFKPRQPRS